MLKYKRPGRLLIQPNGPNQFANLVSEVHALADQEFTTEELESEEWRDVIGFEGFYQCSNLGRVRSNRDKGPSKKGHLLKPGKNRFGYISVHLFRGSRATAKLLTVHKIVTAAFIGPRPLGKEVNHIDNDRTNCRLKNLEYVTHKQNMEHAAKQGRMPRRPGPRPDRQGDNAPTAKLTAKDIVNIRRAILKGFPAAQIAAHFGVTDMTISMIKSGKNWWCVSELRDEVMALGPNKTNHRIPRRRGRHKYTPPPLDIGKI